MGTCSGCSDSAPCADCAPTRRPPPWPTATHVPAHVAPRSGGRGAATPEWIASFARKSRGHHRLSTAWPDRPVSARHLTPARFALDKDWDAQAASPPYVFAGGVPPIDSTTNTTQQSLCVNICARVDALGLIVDGYEAALADCYSVVDPYAVVRRWIDDGMPGEVPQVTMTPSRNTIYFSAECQALAEAWHAFNKERLRWCEIGRVNRCNCWGCP